LAQLDYACTNVFVTFEKEQDQREVLEKLSVGKKYSRNDDPKTLSDPKYVFEGTVLNVREATEPNSIRWAELNIPVSEKLKRITLTTAITLGITFACGMAITLAAEVSPGIGTAFAIASKYQQVVGQRKRPNFHDGSGLLTLDHLHQL
jgi:hypothetical protein